MFFYIGKNCKYLSLVANNLYLDRGWKNTTHDNKQVWYKGYSTQCTISNSVSDIIDGYQPEGIWCLIYQTSTDEYKIHHPEVRGFPLSQTTDYVTNLYDNDVHTEYGQLNTVTKNLDQVLMDVSEILHENCLNYTEYNEGVLNILLTGGLDSTLLVAVCEHYRIPYNILLPTHRKSQASGFVEFVRNTHSNYQFIKIFDKPFTLTTGYYGDNFLCRHPTQINLLANSLGFTAHEMSSADCYMDSYINRKAFEYLKNTVSDVTQDQAKYIIYHGLYPNYQVWHIDDTLTFCPYHDMRLASSVLSLEVPEIVKLSLHGTIQKMVIERLTPGLLTCLDSHKNTFSSGSNLKKNLEKVKLTCVKTIFDV